MGDSSDSSPNIIIDDHLTNNASETPSPPSPDILEDSSHLNEPSPGYEPSSPRYEPPSSRYEPHSPRYSPIYEPSSPVYEPSSSLNSNSQSYAVMTSLYRPAALEVHLDLPIYEPVNPSNNIYVAIPWTYESRNLEQSEDSNPVIVNEESSSSPQDIVKTYENYSEPPAKIRRLSSPKQNDDCDGETCPICLDTWGNSGDHRLVALRCGHLFGAKCVERWLKTQVSKNRSCPTCKRKASMKDLRFIYARRLVAADTTQITALQKQIENLQSEKNRVELELQTSKIAHRSRLLELEVLRKALLKKQVNKEETPRRSWRFALEKNLEICKDGDCRVLTYNCRTYELYISQKSSNYLFPGYGIRKVSCVDYKLGQFMHLHPKPIRDITYSQPRDLLLSAGLDGCVRIVERGIPSSTIKCGVPLWSCSWDNLRSNEFYVGGVGGVICQYDVRNPNTYINKVSIPGDLSPVVSLCSTEFGLLSCQLNSCNLWSVGSTRQWEPHPLPVDGPFMSLCYNGASHQVLVSGRASGSERSKLTLCKLKSSFKSDEVSFDVEHTFSGSSRSLTMSRAAWVTAPGATWVGAHSESESALFLHGLDGARTMSLPAAEPALDVCAAQLNGDTVLAALSASRLRLYKAVSTNS